MNAKELAELYEPLWMLVPETRPTRLLVWLFSEERGWYHDFRARLPNHYSESAEMNDTNAALCRVSVEDWLEEHAPERITVGGSVEGWYVKTCPQGAYHGDLGHGPTIHHALVAAALAVAKAKPV